MIVYEAPHHLIKTLIDLYEVLGNRKITICRELTKKYETAFLTTFEEALEYYEKEEPKGECVIVIQGKSVEEIQREEKESWENMSLEEHMAYYQSQGKRSKRGYEAGGKRQRNQ